MKGVIRGSRYFVSDVGEPEREVSEADYHRLLPDAPSGGGAPGGTPTTGWPIHSRALAYHPKQVEEAREHLKKLGEPTEVKADGTVVLTDRGHRKRLLKKLRMCDNEGGYGD